MKTILITGANKGIGLETAAQLAELGYRVFIGSRSKTNGIEAVEKIKMLGLNNVECVELDVTNMHSIQSAKLELENKIGKLDVLINNAGVSGPQVQNISTIDMDNLRQVFETNFFGVVQTTQQFIPLLKKSENPKIINISSSLGSLTLHQNRQNPNQSIYDAYSCSKTALNAFTVLLANELKDTNFSINAVAPGYTATDLNNFQGGQTVKEAASIIVKAVTIDTISSGHYFYKDGEYTW